MRSAPSTLGPISLSIAIGFALAGQAAFADTSTNSAGTPAAMAAVGANATPVANTGSDSPVSRQLVASEDGYQAMRMIRHARLAIFAGDTAAASDAIQAASNALDAVAKSAPTVRATERVGADGKIVAEAQQTKPAEVIPIDMRVVRDHEYVDTPVKQAHIVKANEYMAKGRSNAAVDELRLAEVDTSFVQTLMPIASTTAQVKAAGDLLGNGEYFEASQALKAAEDGLTTDTFVYVDAPAPTGAR